MGNSFDIYPVPICTEVECDDISFSMDTAIPLGLIINELVNNSYKHAFNNCQEGKIYISLKRDNNERYCLNVEDNGCSFPDNFPAQKGETLGLPLVSALANKLKGSLKIDSPRGARFTITFTEAEGAKDSPD